MSEDKKAFSKDIKDYLHLYLKVWGKITESSNSFYKNGEWALSAAILNEVMLGKFKFTPHLRPLSDMTKHESDMGDEIMNAFDETDPFEAMQGMANMTMLLLKQGFDLFNLIPEGLAIDKTKLP